MDDDTVRAERQWSTPKGLASAATGLAGSAAHSRRNGRGKQNNAVARVRAATIRSGVARPDASDRYRMAETRSRGSGTRAGAAAGGVERGRASGARHMP